MIGRFVIADPAICHGEPTFRGTRILVDDVLEQVAAGIAWEAIVEEWRGNVSSEAIAEAVRLASKAFRDHSARYAAMLEVAWPPNPSRTREPERCLAIQLV